MKLVKKSLHWLNRVCLERWRAWSHQKRRVKRLAQYSIGDRTVLPMMSVDCGEHVDGETCRECQTLIPSYTGFYGKLYRGESVEHSESRQLTMHAIEVQSYGDFASYRKALGKRSCFFLRHANQAAVARSNLSPALHYRVYGRHENRAYRST